MGPRLSLCTACQRHIQSTETACPFCGAATPEGFGATARAPLGDRPLSRAALLFASAAAVAACSSDDSHPAPVPLYGPAPINIPDAGDSGSADDAGPAIDSGLVAAYGPAPVDGGT